MFFQIQMERKNEKVNTTRTLRNQGTTSYLFICLRYLAVFRTRQNYSLLKVEKKKEKTIKLRHRTSTWRINRIPVLTFCGFCEKFFTTVRTLRAVLYL